MKKSNLPTFPILATERLRLRPLEETDELAIFLLRSNDSVNQYIERERPANNRDANAFIKRIQQNVENGSSVFWAISLKDSSNLIGTICLWNLTQDKIIGELGYEMNPIFQGKGLMSEAVKSVLEYGFVTLGLKKIEAYTHKENERSKKLLKKHFFVLEKDRKDEDNENNVIFSLKRNWDVQ
ncbi:GNAT family N-acetyltransferase [Flavobacterium endophyticum]|nr:GNAT family N-acetyltransferase [Flavobacterium endophyticum]